MIKRTKPIIFGQSFRIAVNLALNALWTSYPAVTFQLRRVWTTGMQRQGGKPDRGSKCGMKPATPFEPNNVKSFDVVEFVGVV
jgi:hypothetical protein